MRVRKALFVILMVLGSLGITGCDSDLTPENTVIVVSDAVTGGSDTSGEILPNAIVYKVDDASNVSFTDLIFAEKVEGAYVGFAARAFGEDDWVPLVEEDIDGLIVTDENGRARLPSLEKLQALNPGDEPVTLQLQARVYFGPDSYASDDMGIIRVLSSDANENPPMIAADHDNTIHATGGLNALQDWVDFLNVFQNDWPYVDGDVETVLPKLMEGDNDIVEEKHDLVIVTGMFPEIRFAARAQMMAHFEGGPHRTIPIIIKEDMLYEHSSTFKKECLAILKGLYGKKPNCGGNDEVENVKAMVGDTVRQDGYGAIANDILYIPYQVNYEPDFWLLDTEGYGWIHPDTIVRTWSGVVAKLESGPVERPNYFLKHHTGFKNIAHRGGGELMPENTLEAYQNSLDVGADVLEADVHMTKDGHVVISHDETVDRCTNGSGAIVDMNLAEIKALDAGNGFKIPTLREAFELMAPEGTAPENFIPMVLEIKQEGGTIVDKVLALIAEFNLQNHIILGGFDQSTLELIKEKSAAMELDIKTIFTTEGVLEFTFTPTSIMKKEDYQQPADVLCLPAAMMTQALVSKIRILGMKCYVWTVNTEIEMKRQMNWFKVDGIMTDNPQRLDGVINAE